MVMNKQVFWYALVAAVIVFGIGLMLGFFLEQYRSTTIQENLFESEIHILDEQLRQRVVGDFNVSCVLAEKSLFDFADRIYTEAQKLERFDSSSKFSSSFLILHRRYDLLRTLLWTESISLKHECRAQFHTLVYLYQYSPDDIDMRARQAFYSRLLTDFKQEQGRNVLLIPIATNMNLSSLDLVLANYHFTKTPAIIIDEHTVIDDIVTAADFATIVMRSNASN